MEITFLLYQEILIQLSLELVVHPHQAGQQLLELADLLLL